MVPTKEKVRDLLDRLPDDCSIDDVLYHLYVIQEIELGLADADAGRMIPHEQVVVELRKKPVLALLHEARDFRRWRDGKADRL